MEKIIQFGSIVSAFAILDALIEPKIKYKFADIFFGFHSFNTRNMEVVTIRALLSAFIRDQRVVFWRILTWTLVTTPISFLVYATLRGDEAGIIIDEFGSIFNFLFATLILTASSSILDTWNIWITNEIYGGESNLNSFSAFLLDIALSLLPLALLVVTATSTIFVSDKMGLIKFPISADNFISTYLIASISTLLLFALRLATFILSNIARLLLLITTLNRRIIFIAQVHEHPFTFIGSIVAVIYIAALRVS